MGTYQQIKERVVDHSYNGNTAHGETDGRGDDGQTVYLYLQHSCSKLLLRSHKVERAVDRAVRSQQIK